VISKRRASRDLAIAYHEAGHAVAAFALGISAHNVSIVPDEKRGTEGHVQYVDQIVTARDAATVSLAGPVAQEHRQRRKGIRPSDYLDDSLRARDFLREILPHDSVTPLLKDLEQRARDIVASEEYWPAVEAVAEALVRHRKMTGKQVAECIRNSMA
jgi:hypothetical protein